MSYSHIALLVLSAIFGISQCAPEEDLITSLPGLSTQPHFKQYSGYLTTGTKRLHYWFVESSSNPKVDPLVLWMNGGPGCSSLLGLLTENGPFRLSNKGQNLIYNPHSWNQAANMIFLEAPAGVGFSYATDKNYTTNDDQTATHNFQALLQFFKKFPEYKGHDFYITGESYGGIYVPTLVSRVLDDGTINLKGFAVGNGLSDSNMNTNSLMFFAYYHGIIGQKLWRQVVDACCPSGKADMCDFAKGSVSNLQCTELLTGVSNTVWGSGLDPYNLYSPCLEDNTFRFDPKTRKYISRNVMNPFSFLPRHVKEREFLLSLPREMVSSGPPCVGDDAFSVTYLNRKEVREALHIPEEVQKWDMCSVLDYHTVYTTMAPIYQRALKQKLRILIYNGDVDMACNFLGDEWFVDSLNAQNPRKRRSWNYDDPQGGKQIAGFVKEFDNISFVTIKGAGHMVPADKPVQALEMFINFIQNRPF